MLVRATCLPCHVFVGCAAPLPHAPHPKACQLCITTLVDKLPRVVWVLLRGPGGQARWLVWFTRTRIAVLSCALLTPSPCSVPWLMCAARHNGRVEVVAAHLWRCRPHPALGPFSERRGDQCVPVRRL